MTLSKQLRRIKQRKNRLLVNLERYCFRHWPSEVAGDKDPTVGKLVRLYDSALAEWWWVGGPNV